MTKQQIRLAAVRLLDLAGMTGGFQLVETIAREGYTAEISWIELVGDLPSVDDCAAVRAEVQYIAKRELFLRGALQFV